MHDKVDSKFDLEYHRHYCTGWTLQVNSANFHLENKVWGGGDNHISYWVIIGQKLMV